LCLSEIAENIQKTKELFTSAIKTTARETHKDFPNIFHIIVQRDRERETEKQSKLVQVFEIRQPSIVDFAQNVLSIKEKRITNNV